MATQVIETVICHGCGSRIPLWTHQATCHDAMCGGCDNPICYDAWDRPAYECDDCHQAHTAT